MIPSSERPNGLTIDDAKMCVGQGWHHLIDVFYATFHKYLEHHPALVVSQVKEKFGGLRIYHSSPLLKKGDPNYGNLSELSWWLDVISRKVCETCGRPGRINYKRGWYKTRCADHWDGPSLIEVARLLVKDHLKK